MKRLFTPLLFAALSAMAITACSKAPEEPAPQPSPEQPAPSKMVRLTLSTANPEAVDTRTMVAEDGVTPMWCPGDALGVSVYTDGAYTNQRFTNDNQEPSKTTTFSGETLRSTLVFTYYPYSASGVDADGAALVAIPAVQSPTATSFDGASDLLVGKPVPMPADADRIEGVPFKRVGGFLKIRLADQTGSLAEQHLRSLSVTTEAALAGKARLDIVNGELGAISEDASTTVTATYTSDTQFVVGDAQAAVYLGVYPQTLAANSVFRLVAVTDDFEIERELSLPEAVEIVAGQITTLTVNLTDEHIADKTDKSVVIETAFPDPIFRAYVLENIDTDHDGILSEEEAAAVTEIAVSNFYGTPEQKIASLEGLAYFPNLTKLDCSYNKLTALDMTQNPALETLCCFVNQLTSLDVTQNPALEGLFCQSNQLADLDVTQNPALKDLDCYLNQLTDLDVTQNPALEYLSCSYNKLTSLDVTQNPELKYLDCRSNQLTRLDVTQNPELGMLYCDKNQLTDLDVTQNPALKDLDCSSNQLTDLDVTQNPALKELYCYKNQLTRLDVTQNPALVELNCSQNQLTSLDVSGCVGLETLDCRSNQLTNLNVSGYTALTYLDCSSNQLTSLDVTRNPALTNLTCQTNQLTRLEANGCTALEYLYCYNNQLTSLDVTQNPALTSLGCSNNQLTSLDLSQNPALTSLGCSNNQLTDLDMSQNPALETLSCDFNQLTNLNVNGCTELQHLDCSYNQLTSLDISKINLGYNTSTYPLKCAPMETLDVVYLKEGWSIRGITINRNSTYIPEQTRIVFLSGEYSEENAAGGTFGTSTGSPSGNSYEF